MNADQDRLTVALAGRYTIEREIGRGGMATVYLAHDLKHHRNVAVKVLRPELARIVGPERFLREIEIAARLNHPHILPLYDSGYAEDALFYVMPFVDGESLYDRLTREKQLSVMESISIAREVADALQHAHAHQIVHRDIKPANIMLLSNHAVVSDFGVALLAQAVPVPRLTSSGMMPGTPVYMSPEQAAGSVAIDGRSDIYSLGCVLYEMLSGEPPFRGPTPQAILARKLTTHPLPLHEARESIGESLERVIDKALARTAADRFRSAAEFAEALEAVQLEQRTSDPLQLARATATRDGRGASSTTRAPTAVVPDATTSPLARIIGMAAVAVLLPTAVGFLTTTVYDQTLRVPHQYSPSRADFTITGIRALIPPLFTAFVLLIAFIVVRQAGRMLALAASGSARLRAGMRGWQERTTHGWQRWWGARPPAAIAEIWFVLAIVVSAAVLIFFAGKFRVAPGGDAGIFACTYRSVHTNYTVILTLLLLTLGLSWSRVFRYLRAQRASGVSYQVARWGGVALICVLVLFVTAPWRLLWTESPRAVLNGERYYIVRESDASLLLYNPRARVTEHYRIDEVPQLQRLNTSGYIFESEQSFSGPDAGC